MAIENDNFRMESMVENNVKKAKVYVKAFNNEWVHIACKEFDTYCTEEVIIENLDRNYAYVLDFKQIDEVGDEDVPFTYSINREKKELRKVRLVE